MTEVKRTFGLLLFEVAALVLMTDLVAPRAAGAEYTFTTLATFDGTQGLNPRSSLIRDAGGNLYGTTEYGGEYGLGTVFKVAAGTNALSTLASFDGPHGSNPKGGLVADSSGNLYGTANVGGQFGYGTVFKIASGTNELTALASFDATPHGSNPNAGLIIDSAGNLYGTAENGGNGFGTVFKVAAGTNTLTTVAALDAVHGQFPKGGVIADANGNLYGTTYLGGANGMGTVFKVAAGTNVLSTLATFDGTPHGSNPEDGLVADTNGNLYGTTYYGGTAGYGTVFKVAAGTNAFTRLLSFVDTNGSNPVAGLIVDASGNLYGTTKWDVLNNGTVFRIAAGTNALTTLKLFDGMDGDEPHAGLIADAQGNLYGTTYSGGANNYGIVFKLQKTAAPLLGDYNLNGKVDAADYTVWRDSVGQLGIGLAADGNSDNKIDGGDYTVWKSQFGIMAGSAGGGAGVAAPEPATWILIALLAVPAAANLRKKQ